MTDSDNRPRKDAALSRQGKRRWLNGTYVPPEAPHPEDDGNCPPSLRGSDKLAQVGEMGFGELCKTVVDDLVPDGEGHTLEAILAESCAWDAVRLREVVAAQFLNPARDEKAGAVQLDGLEDLTFEGEQEGEGEESPLEESLADRMRRIGPDLNRSLLPPADLRQEEGRLTKQLLDKLRALRKDKRTDVLNERDQRGMREALRVQEWIKTKTHHEAIEESYKSEKDM